MKYDVVYLRKQLAKQETTRVLAFDSINLSFERPGPVDDVAHLFAHPFEKGKTLSCEVSKLKITVRPHQPRIMLTGELCPRTRFSLSSHRWCR